MSVKTVWLDNPPVNAISRGITEHLWAELEELGDASCVVLRGRGDKGFSAGADITGFQVQEGADGDYPAGITPLAEFIETLPVPTVAAVHGYCLGGGLEVALACDLRIATADAQFGFPEVTLGLLPGGGGTQRTPRLIGRARAAWLIMSGERIPAERAERWGLIEFLVDELEAGIEQIAGRLAAQSPHALRQIKQLLAETAKGVDYEREFRGFVECLQSSDGQEGVAAFLEKREPRWAAPVRAAVLHEVDGDLAVEDVPDPGGPALDVRAAGLNYADVLIRRGRYPQMPELPFVPGSEVAGELDGRRVAAMVRGNGGGYAERVAIDPDWVFDLPEDASYAEGAAFLLTYLTAWIPLTRQAHVRPGQTVLVHAAAGGVGSASIQVAKHLGARVVATAGSADKQQVARDLGAEEAYGYDEFAAAVKVDHVLDPVGGAIFADSLKALNPLGSVVAIGFAAGLWADVNPQFLVGRNISVHGFFLGRLMQLRPEVVREAIAELFELWRGGAFKPLIGAELPLDRVNDALDLLESRKSVGKVVLVV